MEGDRCINTLNEILLTFCCLFEVSFQLHRLSRPSQLELERELAKRLTFGCICITATLWTGAILGNAFRSWTGGSASLMGATVLITMRKSWQPINWSVQEADSSNATGMQPEVR